MQRKPKGKNPIFVSNVERDCLSLHYIDIKKLIEEKPYVHKQCGRRLSAHVKYMTEYVLCQIKCITGKKLYM